MQAVVSSASSSPFKFCFKFAPCTLFSISFVSSNDVQSYGTMMAIWQNGRIAVCLQQPLVVEGLIQLALVCNPEFIGLMKGKTVLLQTKPNPK